MTVMGKLAAGLAAVFLLAGAAQAQTEADFVAAFSGDWQVYDDRFSEDGGRCRISLQQQAADGNYALTKDGCAGALAAVSNWGIVDAQMALLNGGDAVVLLGGNQRRMSGSTAQGEPVILERVGSAGMIDALQAAYRLSGCYYLGFTDDCAPEAAIAKPEPVDGEIRINVLANLNVRSEARDDAGILGVVPAQSCIVAETCVTASDGVWCRAAFGDRAGWLRQLALRQSRWPIVTYTNTCPAGSEAAE
jgi:hypothetical protein